MLFLLLFIPLAVVALIYFIKAGRVLASKRAGETPWRYSSHIDGLDESGAFWVGLWVGVAAAALLVTIIVLTAVGYTSIISDRAQIDATFRNEAILKDRADTIGETLKEYLVAQYPQYEQGTIDKVLKAGPDLILLKFPELRTADTFIKYANDYKRLQSDVYAEATRRSELKAHIASVRDNGMIYISGLLP